LDVSIRQQVDDPAPLRIGPLTMKLCASAQGHHLPELPVGFADEAIWGDRQAASVVCG
jgi:hypothetical protein